MPVYPSGGAQNTYLPQIEAAEDLRIRYLRPNASFALSRWTKTRTVEHMVGYYNVIGRDQFSRITTATLSQAKWPDGKPMPNVTGNTENYDLKPFQTERLVFGFEMGALGVEQAPWDIVRDHADGTMMRMMTLRAYRAITAATTSANYSGMTATQATIMGSSGKGWGVSSSSLLYIKQAINYAVNKIIIASRGSISVEDLKLVISPTLAQVISVSPEIVSLMQYREGDSYIRGRTGRNASFGLPEVLYGCELVIEDTVQVTNQKGDTTAESYVFPDATAVVCVRKGGPDNGGANESYTGGNGASVVKPSYDSVQIFEYRNQALSIETKYDDDNKMWKGRVIDNSDIRVVAPNNSFLLTALLT